MLAHAITNEDVALAKAARIYAIRAQIKELQSEEAALKDALMMDADAVEGVCAFSVQTTKKVDYKGVLSALSVDYGIAPDALAGTVAKYTKTVDAIMLKFAKNYHI
jgi:hypothetical protein